MERTPEEIKKGLECCYSSVEPIMRCEQCPYYGSIVCKMSLHTDSLALIQQLQEEVSKYEEGYDALTKIIKRLEAERDAAVSELVGTCQVCRWEGTEKCDSCHFCEDAWNVHESNWEWSGIKKKEE